ncbi:MAG: prolipoprotein diacylglyceryl transferase [Oscillospiraceae bacterium]|nr:prolipoprotein diacylglyceryl transferase [Oscillospiraceae bacterium]
MSSVNASAGLISVYFYNCIMVFNVSFPHLGINLKINPLAFEIAGISIRWYGIILAIAFASGTILTLYQNRREKIIGNENDLLDLILLASFGGIVGARIYYIVFYPGAFAYDKWLNIRSGGLAIYGSLLGGLAALFCVCKYKKIETKNILNLFSPATILAQAIGRWGNFVNQEAFGTQTNIFLGMSSEATNFKTVHPCFFYESLWCILGFLLIYHICFKKRFEFYLIWYPVGRFLIEMLRTDSLLIPYTNIKVSEITSIVLILFFIVLNLKNNKSIQTLD